MQRHSCAFALAIGFGLCGVLMAPDAWADRELAQFQGITVAVADDFTCGERIKIKLSAPEAALFKDNQRMEQLVGAVRAMLGECDTFKDVMFEGSVNGEPVYRAVTSEKSQWTLLTLAPPVSPEVEGGASSTSSSTAPDASVANTAGQSFLPELPPASATQGATSQPAAPTPEASAVPNQAASSAPSGTVDPFAKMQENLGAASAGGRGAIDFQSFNQPVMIEAFHTGDFELIPQNDFSVLLYIDSFNKFFSQTVNFLDPSCVLLYRPAIQKRVIMDSQTMMLGGGSVEEQGVKVLEMMNDFMRDMQQGGPQMLTDRMTNVEMVKDQAEKDAAHLAIDYKCQSPTTKTIYSNMEAYVMGTEPILSPEVARRRQLVSFTKGASESCIKQYSQPDFCYCVIGKLREVQLGDEEWAQIAGEFTSVARLSGKYPLMRDAVVSCMK